MLVRQKMMEAEVKFEKVKELEDEKFRRGIYSGIQNLFSYQSELQRE